MSEVTVRKSSLNFWKPYQGKGAVAFFELNIDKGTCWLSMMAEASDGDGKKFDPSTKINVSLGIPDVCNMLLVLEGEEEGLGSKNDKGHWSGLMHKTDAASAFINLARNENGPGYYLGISRKEGQNQAVRHSIKILPWEARGLVEFLRNALLTLMYSEEKFTPSN